MPEFVNQFTRVVPWRKMADTRLLHAPRLDLSAQEEATPVHARAAVLRKEPCGRNVIVPPHVRKQP